MKNLAVFGNPIDHSLSPIMHNFVYNALKISAEYGRVLIENAKDMRAKFLALDRFALSKLDL